MLISQQITNLLNGVSQRPQVQRHPSQVTAQTNGLSSIVRGLMKRPPLLHFGKLTSTITGWASAFIHTVNRDESERYHVAIVDGDVIVYDALTGDELTVLAPAGTAYLADAAGAGFRAATAGDTTIIVNRGVAVAQGDTKAAAPTFEALVYVRQADFATTYQITLNDVDVTIQTAAATAAEARQTISTDNIATDLVAALEAETLLSDFTFTRLGSTVHIERTDAKDFTLATHDGLADKGLKAVKGEIQAFADLPRRAPNGFRVEITGDVESAQDNYWVQFDDSGNPDQEGVWRECPKPGTPVSLDASTMPHRLVRHGSVMERQEHSVIDGADATIVDVLDSTTADASVLPWETYEPAGTAIGGVTPELRDHNGAVKLTLTEGAGRLFFNYRIDTSLVEVGNDVTVTLSQNGAPIGTNTHRPGVGQIMIFPPIFGENYTAPLRHSIGQGAFDVVGSFATSDEIEMTVSYVKGNTPGQYRRAYVVPDSVTVFAATVREIRFADVYPPGTVITVDADGDEFQHIVGSSQESGSTVATAFQALIDADADFTATVSGATVQVTNVTTGTYPEISVTAVLDSTKVFSNPDLAMTTNEHIGRTIKNHSDGSTGTITANTATTITCSAGLTGGVDNVFTPGDICSVVGTGRYFVFEPCPWNERGAGDLEIVPFPSFLEKEISEVFFYENRLGFTSQENVVFSASGDLFNFFRYSAAQLLSSDTIDVRSSHAEVSLFHSAVLWNESLYLLSDNAQWLVSAEPALTPTTTRIDIAGRFPNSPKHRPFVAGSRLFTTRKVGDFTQVLEFAVVDSDTGALDAADATADVSKYLEGEPLGIAGDPTLGHLAVLTDADGQLNLYVFSYRDDGEGRRVQASWSRWEFGAGQIVGIDCIDGKLGLAQVHDDGVYLGTIDLKVALDTISTDEGAQYLDRRVTNSSTGVSAAYNAGTDTTTWTLPYEVDVDGSEGALRVVRRSPSVSVLSTTRPAANQIAVTGQGDLTAASVYIGVAYTFTVELSRLYYRQDGLPQTNGRTTLQYLDVLYHATTDFDVEVTLAGRTPYTYAFDSEDGLPTEGSFRVPIKSRNEYTTIELVNSSPGACAFVGLDWEGEYSTRSRRV